MLRETIASLLLALAVAVPSAAAEIRIDHDEATDFGAIRTYTWNEGTPAAIPQVQEWIVAAVDRELQAKGLSRVDGDADIHVSTVAYGEMDVFVRGNYVGLQSGWGVTTAHASDKTTGNLVLDLIDPATDKPVWRGVVKEGFQSDKLDRAEKKIDKLVKKLFKSFPPK